MRIDLAQDKINGILIGYCVSTISKDNQGEIDSIYIEEDYRNKNLIQKAIMKLIVKTKLIKPFARIYLWADLLSFKGYLLQAKSILGGKV